MTDPEDGKVSNAKFHIPSDLVSSADVEGVLDGRTGHALLKDPKNMVREDISIDIVRAF